MPKPEELSGECGGGMRCSESSGSGAVALFGPAAISGMSADSRLLLPRGLKNKETPEKMSTLSSQQELLAAHRWYRSGPLRPFSAAWEGKLQLQEARELGPSSPVVSSRVGT